jgi:hypothetical protein
MELSKALKDSLASALDQHAAEIEDAARAEGERQL